MALLVKVLYLSIFGIFIVWGYLPHDGGINPITDFIYEHTQGLRETEINLLIHLIVPGFIMALGWTSWDLLLMLDDKVGDMI
ncbi:hypothetical protein FJQ87_03910 [Shewanella sp. SNU WT4]|uniref:hypothetical protein n=1 Tax=Shewanella sp. SNU WT4 TaxID=2590015 RepID=UPI00112CE371|nr:hypothetical protein [Shewanella sp. SNU WT4]QDF65931.1 hypothetical protein FJQ87_03910 [Shewanella sp. SNU WT4]